MAFPVKNYLCIIHTQRKEIMNNSIMRSFWGKAQRRTTVAFTCAVQLRVADKKSKSKKILFIVGTL